MSYRDPYVTPDELKRYLRITTALTAEESADIDTACRAATTEVTNHCGRNFNRDTTGTGWPDAVPDDLYVNTIDQAVYVMTGTQEFPVWTAFGGTIHTGIGEPVDGTTDGATGDLYQDTTAYDLDPEDGWYRCTDGTANTWTVTDVLADGGVPTDAPGPTTRLFSASRADVIKVDDFWTLTDAVVETDPTGSGQFSTVWDSADYQAEPLNRIQDGVPGWSYHTLRNFSAGWPVSKRAQVRVTAHFGWEALPDVVKEAALMVAGETYKMREAPLGVAGWSEFGAIRVRDIPKVAKMLYPFQYRRVMITRR